MNKINIVDYFIEESDWSKTATDDARCCSVTTFFTFQQENIEQLDINECDYFNITVGTPAGLKKHFDGLNKAVAAKMIFLRVAIVERFDEEAILAAIRKKIENLSGKNERELILQGLLSFEWQYQDDAVELKKLLHG
jgi:hypothetical protein